MKPKQLYIALWSVLGLIILLSLVGFWQAHQNLNKKILELKKLGGDLVLENEQIIRLQKLEAQYREIEPLAQKVEAVLPEQKAQDTVVAQISVIVRRNGLDLNGLTFEKTTGIPDERSQTQSSKISGILVMPIKFQTTGSYSQLRSMLRDFERQQRFMRVNTLDISRNLDSTISAGVILEVFLKP